MPSKKRKTLPVPIRLDALSTLLSRYALVSDVMAQAKDRQEYSVFLEISIRATHPIVVDGKAMSVRVDDEKKRIIIEGVKG